MKKGEISWDYLGRILIILAIFLIIVLLMWLFRDKLYLVWNHIKENILTMGG